MTYGHTLETGTTRRGKGYLMRQAVLNWVLDSGEGIAAMRAAIDDTEFADDLLDDEGREEWRGRLTGRQMRRWVRRNWSGGEAGFVDDNDLGGDRP